MTEVAGVRYQQHTSTRQRIVPRSALRFGALGVLAFCFPVIIAVTTKGFVYDDPFILMRYGQHLADGHGWNFNPGSATNNAVTSPLYVLFIAAGTLVGGSPETWSLCIYVACWGLGGIVLAHILRLDGRRVAAWLACALYSVDPLLANVRGMETSLYLLLIVAAIWAFQRDRWLLLGCLLGLLAMTRTDAALLGAALIGWLAFGRRQAALWVLGSFATLTAAWTTALWALTGSPFPSTLAAKMAQRDSGQWGSQLGYLHDLGSYGIAGSETPSALVLFAAVPVLCAAVMGTLAAFRRAERALPMITAAAIITVIEYGVVFRLPVYFWHYGPWILWVVAASAVGLEEGARRWRVIAVLGALTACVGFLSAIDTGPKPSRAPYHEVAQWIDRDSSKTHPTVASSEIGAIGYYSRADMIDYLGLLDSRADLSVRRRDFTWWLTEKPDYWVTAGDFVDANTKMLPDFVRDYRAAATFGPLTVYRRIA